MPLCRELLKGEQGGKMFGVLVVEAEQPQNLKNSEPMNLKSPSPPLPEREGAISWRAAPFGGRGASNRYFLTAFSGILAGSYFHDGFVPPIYNLQHPAGHFKQEEAEITAINHRIRSGEDTAELRAERRQRSIALQQWIFMQFNLLNGRGERQNLTDLFRHQPRILSEEEYFNKAKTLSDSETKEGKTRDGAFRIPSGSGECCAPKLLQYAYLHHLRPVCMAEFWLGPSPKDELRIDGNYYPACHAKCKPILTHMLQGLDVEENPMLKRSREMAAQVEYLYEDDDIAVVCKPGGLLSTPGKDDVPSLLDIVHQRHPQAVNAHRLDMDTSGVMVFALNDKSYHHLQAQFYRQEVRKQYVALLDGHPLSEEGTISLPLLPNPLDRPRQMVNHEHGKRAVTQYKLLGNGNRILFIPKTGRTHQLRIHAAHPEGLGCPIKGDPLYGTPADRLYLHAESITFCHPATGKRVTFCAPAPF